MKTNQDYKNAALAQLKGNWSQAVLASVVLMLVAILFNFGANGLVSVPSGATVFLSSGASIIVSCFLIGPLNIGFANATRVLYERGDANVLKNTWNFATCGYLRMVLGYFFMTLKIVLWTCLLIVPGIIMSFAYAMTPYILAENPELSAWDASTRSREMMKGHKFDFFYLCLSFIGWGILAVLTLGIGFIWLVPYIQTTVAAFYNDLKSESGYQSIAQ